MRKKANKSQAALYDVEVDICDTADWFVEVDASCLGTVVRFTDVTLAQLRDIVAVAIEIDPTAGIEVYQTNHRSGRRMKTVFDGDARDCLNAVSA